MSIPPPREPRDYIVHKSTKLTEKDEKFFEEHKETIEKYNEKLKPGQDLTILEVKDSREIVELEPKEVIKKKKEITNSEDLPKGLVEKKLSDKLVEQILMEMDLEEEEVKEEVKEEEVKEEEETTQGEVVESQPMQIEGEEEAAEEDEAARNARELEEGFTVEYLVKNFITTSSEEPKQTVDLKYMNIRLVFDPDYSLYISSDTRLSSKTVDVQEVKNGSLVNNKQLRIFTNSDYKITGFEGETRQRKDLQEDLDYTRRTKPNEERYIPTGMSPKVSLFKHIKFGNAEISLGVTNTIFVKSIAETGEGEKDPMDNYNDMRYYFYKCKDVVDRRNELNKWFHTHNNFKGFNEQLDSSKTQLNTNEVAFAEANQRLINDIQNISGESATRKDGTPYISVEQYLEDFGIKIDKLRDACVSNYEQGIFSEENYQEFLQAIENYVKTKNDYIIAKNIYDYENIIEKKLLQCYLDVLDNDTNNYDTFNRARNQINSFERTITGEKKTINKPKFSIQIQVVHAGRIRDGPHNYSNKLFIENLL